MPPRPKRKFEWESEEEEKMKKEKDEKSNKRARFEPPPPPRFQLLDRYKCYVRSPDTDPKNSSVLEEGDRVSVWNSDKHIKLYQGIVKRFRVKPQQTNEIQMKVTWIYSYDDILDLYKKDQKQQKRMVKLLEDNHFEDGDLAMSDHVSGWLTMSKYFVSQDPPIHTDFELLPDKETKELVLFRNEDRKEGAGGEHRLSTEETQLRDFVCSQGGLRQHTTFGLLWDLTFARIQDSICKDVDFWNDQYPWRVSTLKFSSSELTGIVGSCSVCRRYKALTKQLIVSDKTSSWTGHVDEGCFHGLHRLYVSQSTLNGLIDWYTEYMTDREPCDVDQLMVVKTIRNAYEKLHKLLFETAEVKKTRIEYKVDEDDEDRANTATATATAAADSNDIEFTSRWDAASADADDDESDL